MQLIWLTMQEAANNTVIQSIVSVLATNVNGHALGSDDLKALKPDLTILSDSLVRV